MKIAVLNTGEPYGGLYHGTANTALALSTFAEAEVVSEPPKDKKYDWVWFSDVNAFARQQNPCVLHVHGWSFPQLTPYAPIHGDWLDKIRRATVCVVSSAALASRIPAPTTVAWNCYDPGVFFPAPDPGQGLVTTITIDGEAALWRKGADRLDALGLPIERLGTPKKLTPEQVADALRDSRIFIHLSRFESCSLSIIEALACGLPVICTDVGDNREMVGKAGAVLPESLVDSYPEAIGAAMAIIEKNYSLYRLRAIAQSELFRPGRMGEKLCGMLRSAS